MVEEHHWCHFLFMCVRFHASTPISMKRSRNSFFFAHGHFSKHKHKKNTKIMCALTLKLMILFHLLLLLSAVAATRRCSGQNVFLHSSFFSLFFLLTTWTINIIQLFPAFTQLESCDEFYNNLSSLLFHFFTSSSSSLSYSFTRLCFEFIRNSNASRHQ